MRQSSLTHFVIAFKTQENKLTRFPLARKPTNCAVSLANVC